MAPRQYGIFLVVLWLLAVRSVYADDASAIDVDGDGDVDDDDRKALEAAEQIEVKDVSAAQAQAESSRAVTVVDLKRARERGSDLGEVLSRTPGVVVRRTGGLGSTTRFSLNGLYDEQVRFFLDGIPLVYAGFGLGVANVPVDLLDRVDVYRGVVPIAFGADALGGAVDLVTDPTWVPRAAISYQIGSFGLHRLSLATRVRDAPTGLTLGISLFVDRARNDYPIDVEVANDVGALVPARVRRFHDAYLAGGAIVEAGIVKRDIIERALVRVYETTYAKDLQHNFVMSVPYGEASYGGGGRGFTGDVALASGPWRGRIVLGGARSTTDFRDVSGWVYNWYGERLRERASGAEVGTSPTDVRSIERALFSRTTVERAFGADQRVRVSLAPTITHRTGIDFLDPNPNGRDPANARREALQIVTGVEHALTSGDLENTVFGKHYYLSSDAEDPQAGFTFARLKSSLHRFGLGDSARWRLSSSLLAKASYEWATRLPSATEMFGDGVLVTQNLALHPEHSHNANLGLQLAREPFRLEMAAFARLADQLIVLLGNERNLMYQNVFAARIVGLESSAGWSIPWASVTGGATLQDVRNASSDGTFAAFEGDRIPNRPWLFASLQGMVRRRDLVRDDDELALFATSRFVYEFYRAWESQGLRQFKQIVPTQLVHSVGITYAARGITSLAFTLEVQNVTDAQAYDSYGVQRSGRALSFKVTGEL